MPAIPAPTLTDINMAQARRTARADARARLAEMYPTLGSRVDTIVAAVLDAAEPAWIAETGRLRHLFESARGRADSVTARVNVFEKNLKNLGSTAKGLRTRVENLQRRMYDAVMLPTRTLPDGTEVYVATDVRSVLLDRPQSAGAGDHAHSGPGGEQ